MGGGGRAPPNWKYVPQNAYTCSQSANRMRSIPENNSKCCPSFVYCLCCRYFTFHFLVFLPQIKSTSPSPGPITVSPTHPCLSPTIHKQHPPKAKHMEPNHLKASIASISFTPSPSIEVPAKNCPSISDAWSGWYSLRAVQKWKWSKE